MMRGYSFNLKNSIHWRLGDSMMDVEEGNTQSEITAAVKVWMVGEQRVAK